MHSTSRPTHIAQANLRSTCVHRATRSSGQVHWGLLLIVATLVALGAYFSLRPVASAPRGVANEPAAGELKSTTSRTPELATLGTSTASPAESALESDRAVVAPSTSQAPPMLTVLWEDGAPIAGVEVALSHAEQVLQLGNGDSAGQLVIEAPEASQAHILRDNLLLFSAALEPGASSYELRVPLGVALEGRVLVDGAPPGQPLELQLSTDPAAWRALPKWLAAALTAAHGPMWSLQLSVATDPLGRFHVDGLEASWSGSIQAPDLFGFASGDWRYSLERPRSGIILELTQRPALRGIAIDPNGQPAPGATVSYTIEGTYGEGSWSGRSQRTGSVVTSAEGGFAIALGGDKPVSIHLEITSGAGGYLAQTIALDGLEDRDLGALQLLATREVQFHVAGADGQPIQAAIVSFSGGRSEPTDAEGRTQLSGLPLESIEVWADALAFSRSHNTLDSPAPNPVELQLERQPSLEVLFLTKAGDPVAGLRFHMQGGAFLQEQPGNEQATQIALGATRMGGSTMRTQPDGSLEIEGNFTTDINGRLFVTGLVPGVRIELGAEDVSGQALDWKAALVLQAGEARLLEVRLKQPTAWLTGRVTDRAGDPIPGAQVDLFDDQNSNPFSPQTDTTGEFRLGPLVDAAVDVWVDVPGRFAPRLVLGHATAEPLLVQLEEGHELVVDARNGSGQEWPIQSLSAQWKRRSITRGELQEDGRWLLEHLPELEFELELRVLDTQFVLTPAPGASEATLTIPNPGKVELTWPQGLLPTDPATLRASLNFIGQNGTRAYGSYPLGEAEAKSNSRTFEALLPGDYSFTLQWITADNESKSLEVDGTIQSDQQTDLRFEQ